MEDVVAIVMIFGFVPLMVLGKHYLKILQIREERKALPTAQDQEKMQQEKARLEALAKENAQLRGRVENLETIVLSSDNSVNRRLEKLLQDTQHSVMRLNALEHSSAWGVGASRQLTGLHEPWPNLGARYQIREEIGRGGFGTVYRAQDVKLNEMVALKVLPPAMGAISQAQERFIHEASASRKITHPNVIRIHDLGEEKGRAYISMEYFPSVSLKQLIRSEGALPWRRVSNLGSQVLAGLAAAHAQGVIHRDLKPHNILVGKGDLCKLIDFGLAKSGLGDGLTSTGAILGTPEYMSPEQVKGQAVGAAADLYSFGVVVYEMLSGQVPFQGDNAVTLGYKHLQEPAPPLRSPLEPLPEPLFHLVEKLLRKEPRERFASVGELAEAWSQIRA